MTSLLDIGDLTETVELRGKKIEVRGISAEGLLVLLGKFPELRVIMTNGADEKVIASLTEKLPQAVFAIIAAGCGDAGNEKAEAVAAKLSVGEQLDAFGKIWKLTFPRGIVDFIKALETLAGELEGAAGIGSAVSGKDQDTKSPGPSSTASATDIPQT